MSITLAVKCAIDEKILINIEKASISALETYTNSKYLSNKKEIKKYCKKFLFRYEVHAPPNGYEPEKLRLFFNIW